MKAESDKGSASERHRWQFSLRGLLVMPVLVALLLGLTMHRIESNQRQRQAVHGLWQMGVLTSEGDRAPFMAPLSGIDWVWHHREGWMDDLLGTHKPIALLFTEDQFKDRPRHGTELAELVNTIDRVPSIEAVLVEGTAMSAEDVEKLRQSLPGIEVRQVRRSTH